MGKNRGKCHYPLIESGEAFILNPQKEAMGLACCDCGLVHRVEIRVAHRQKVTLRFYRLARETAQHRRQKRARGET
ncbi:hypothetical protein LCGC14_2737420 [marine sediment metagenome]|uniref:Uncharacterized protein n=1 Tax=marine sediment metagenome TaxID=412755 RepID=A0A0F8Z5F9_9ZZZZ